MGDMALVDPALHRSLGQMEALCAKKQHMSTEDAAQLTLDGCPIESLCLDFTLPSYPDVELVEGGKQMTVTLENMHQYCRLVREHYLGIGLDIQRQALCTGFGQVLDLESLSVFS